MTLKFPKFVLLASIVLSSQLFVGCAEMQKQYVAQVCNKEGAYQEGYNAAQKGREMNNAFASQCPDKIQETVKVAYREGYTAAQAQKPTQINIVHEQTHGPGWSCKEAFGNKTCGYDCKEAFGKIKCAQYSGHNCVESFGEIHCGLNCRPEFGEIKCDRHE